MRNTLLFLTLILSGCSVFNSDPEDNLEVDNSPCACIYWGEQLNTAPSNEEQRKIAELQFSEVA